MENLISTVEELLQQKKQNLKYSREELKRGNERLIEDQKSVDALESELNQLKKLASSCFIKKEE